MKSIVDTVKYFNRLFSFPPVFDGRKERKNIEGIVSKNAQISGDVSLYLGRYITREDVYERIKMLSSYSFVSRGFLKNV